MALSTLPYTVCGSTVVGGHVIPIGAKVRVSRAGVVQPWGDVVVVRHDRNRTYRLRFTNDTYVTAYETELEIVG